ncbi:MAG: 3-oxoacyl-ACP synthase [Defluviitaleaceae bacterium]|nr:3-oxoacyl-ACP synthase [Defluviitaleaceae bacterium]
MKINVGVAGLGIYVPKGRMRAAEISAATKGAWSEDAIINKLGIVEKPIPGADDGTQEMGVRAARAALVDAKMDASEIDVILCMGEEWKEYPLTTSALYIQHQIGAVNAWGIDVQNRCCTTVSAIKMAKDMIVADDEVNVVMVVGGYRNGDFVDFTDSNVSMMFNLSAGGGAIILKENLGRNVVLGTHIKADGAFAHDAGVEIGGINNPFTLENMATGYQSLRLMNAQHMKTGLNAVSMPNWYECIDKALEKSNMTRDDIDYLAILHFKKSMHDVMLKELGLTEDQSIYLSDYGHMGQVDQLLSLKLALETGKVKEGSRVLLVAAGIGYVWSASVIKWGSAG